MLHSSIVAAAGLVVTLAGMAMAQDVARAGGPIRALLLTGKNNHNWQYTSRVHEDTLEATGLFQVDVGSCDYAPGRINPPFSHSCSNQCRP